MYTRSYSRISHPSIFSPTQSLNIRALMNELRQPPESPSFLSFSKTHNYISTNHLVLHEDHHHRATLSLFHFLFLSHLTGGDDLKDQSRPPLPPNQPLEACSVAPSPIFYVTALPELMPAEAFSCFHLLSPFTYFLYFNISSVLWIWSFLLFSALLQQ